MTTEEARKYFKNMGLTYADISMEEFERLHTILSTNLEVYKTKTEHAQQMDMTVRHISNLDKKFSRGKLVRGEILIDGSYFESRVGIAFESNGFIEFATEFSITNTEPIIEAFIKWCDELASTKRLMGEGNASN